MTKKSTWGTAAVITMLVGVMEARVVLSVIQDLTVVDVAALLVTGWLAGLFAGLHIMHRRLGA